MARIEPYPPCSPEAEAAVLGALLIDPDALPAVAGTLQPSDFYLERNQWIYEVILSLRQANTPIDTLTVEDELRRRGWYDQAGWAVTNELVSKTPSSLHLEAYARAVAKASRRRKWIDAAGKIAGAAYSENGDQDPAELAREVLASDWQPGAGGWEWRTLEDACRPKPPRQYLAGGMLPLPSLCTVYGPSGDLKTMLVLDLAISTVTGLDWLPPLPGEEGTGRPCQAGPVLWIDVDNGQDRTERRLQAIARGHDAPAVAPLRFVSFPTPPFVASDSGSVAAVISKALDLGAKLIVVDNLGTISGGADENSSQMIAVMAGLRTIAEQAWACVLVIHHRSKQNRGRAGDALRGHTSIEAALDLALAVDRPEGEDVITLKSTKSRDAQVEPFSALWTFEQDDAGELVAGRFFGLGRPESEALTKREQAEMCLILDLPDGASQAQAVELLKEQAGVSRCTTLAALKSLVRQKKLYTEAGGPGRAVLYYHA